VLPEGARVKVLGFVKPGDHPTLGRTLAHVEILGLPKGWTKITVGKKGYVLAFDVYTKIDKKVKPKGGDTTAKSKRRRAN
jgi:hypothetical protein